MGEDVGVVVDESRWPLILMHYPPQLSDVMLQEHLVRMDGLLRRSATSNMPIAMALDGVSAKPFAATQRRMQAAWNRANREAMQRSVVGIAFATQSAIVRGAITAIFWLDRPPYPYRICATPAEAIAWSEAQLASARAAPTAR